MMIERIVAALKGLRGASDWKMVERRSSGLEWYFVGSRLDTARSVEKTTYEVAVYADGGSRGGKTRGECTVRIPDGAEPVEIAAILARAADTASAMRNPWFPLAEPGADAPPAPRSGFEGMAMGDAMEALRLALYRPDGLGGAVLNSLELFLARRETRILNSLGVDVSYADFAGHSEFVVNAGKGRDEVELWTELDFSEPDGEKLAAAVGRRLEAAADRLAARPTPDCEGLPLLLSGELSGSIYGYFDENLFAQAVYEKRSNFSLGAELGAAGGAGGEGDRLELAALPAVPGSPFGAPYDLTGFPLRALPCIEGGRVVRLVAPLKYAHYLGVPATGHMSLFSLGPGRQSAAELRAAPHIEAVDFSDFFVDSTTGDFGGEIRLAYLSREGRRVPVTGGSITGSVAANLGRILLSEEVEEKSRSLSPRLCLLPEVRVAPAG